MRQHLPISALVLLFVGLALLYNAVTPIGEGPDEPGHGQYVLFLAREGRLPVQCAPPCQSDVPGSGHHPPLAYLLATPLVSWLPPDERRVDMPGNRRFTWAGGQQVNAVAHGTRERWPWAREVWAWRAARLASTAAGVATVALTYLAARTLTNRGPRTTGHGPRAAQAAASPHDRGSAIPLLAAALVALNPQFIFTSALISNDALLAALGAAMLWLVVDQGPGTRDQGRSGWPLVAGRRWSLRRATLVGLALGLALLTKQSAVVLVPVAAMWALLDREPWTRPQRPGNVWSLVVGLRPAVFGLRSLAAVLGVAAAVCGWWYVRNWRLYGDPLGLDMFRAEFVTQAFDPLSVAAWAQALAQLHASFWARFGWMNLPPPAWVNWAYAALGLAAVAGLALARATGDGRRNVVVGAFRSSVRSVWPLAALPALALAWVLSFALTAGLVAWQGRLVFPAISAVAVLLAGGLASLDGTRHTAQGKNGPPLLVCLVAVAFAALALWLPLGVIRPAYPNPALTEREALARLGTPTYGRFARDDEAGAELRGWQVAGTPRPGATLDLTLTWHAPGRQNRDWWAFVHLVDAAGTPVAEANAEVGGEVFPMLQWLPGDWMQDRQPLELPAGLAPGSYELRVGLWYPPTGRRARMYDREGELAGDAVTLGTLVVTQ